MKNIHVLPTDKPSRLHSGNSGLVLCDLKFNSDTINAQHIYITSNEEIKEGDWFIANNGVHKCIRVDNNTSCPFITLNSKGEEIGHFKTWKTKITHSTDIEFNEVYYIPLSEVKELIGEVDVLQESKNYVLSKFKSDTDLEQLNCYKHIETYILGYNQAIEDNKEKKYTEEDIIRIVEKSRKTGLTAEYLLLSLQPKTEWEVEFIDGKLKLI